MLRSFLRTKIHRATITAADRDYEGSISIDRALCRAAGLLEFEEVDVYDITNGERFTTYVIFGDTGQIQVNGAAANLVKVGDLIIIAGYAELSPDEIRQHRATIVHVDEKNQLKTVAATVVREP